MKKILLVEDNENIMELNAKYLTLKEYLVEKAYTVKEADAKTARSMPDLIVMDIMLPDGNGVELCEKIRERSGTPILFLSAKGSDMDIISGLKRGGDDYLIKPYDLDVFGARVEALLRRTEQAIQGLQTYTVGSLRFDIIMSRVYVDQEELNLSGKEFGILFYLAQHWGRVVSRDTLYAAVWGVPNKTENAVLWTTVSRLKKKIAGYSDLFYIDSDHSGYELVMIPQKQKVRQ